MNPNPINYQAIELWQTLSDKETTLTFKQAAIKTWKLLQQAGRLLFLVSLFFVVVVVWLWSVAYRSGKDFRYWLETAQVSPETLFSTTLDILVQRPIAWLVNWSEVKRQELMRTPEVKALISKTESK
ncbi:MULTISPECIES: hypothetical protein [unclassified Nodularia (in: cyanobacteria)]|uniref:hypothetical protein n=1 Tax=unclassified Nodularia (in: cyanobacteria) TaxID=2656917 RepID=UPI00187F0773|nr:MULTISPECIES: hypothetical protein [unclassified Nodularia (in: cyanobacteria)]MBE9199606.1 hypothetical protein [Nodularia sp. LEGE 06071]MCC2694935.1 hypothetical protein [Nodularia sp. LEGE 04288]